MGSIPMHSAILFANLVISRDYFFNLLNFDNNVVIQDEIKLVITHR